VWNCSEITQKDISSNSKAAVNWVPHRHCLNKGGVKKSNPPRVTVGAELRVSDNSVRNVVITLTVNTEPNVP